MKTKHYNFTFIKFGREGWDKYMVLNKFNTENEWLVKVEARTSCSHGDLTILSHTESANLLLWLHLLKSPAPYKTLERLEQFSQRQGGSVLSKDLSSLKNKDAALHPTRGLGNCTGSHRSKVWACGSVTVCHPSNEPCTVTHSEKQCHQACGNYYSSFFFSFFFFKQRRPTYLGGPYFLFIYNRTHFWCKLLLLCNFYRCLLFFLAKEIRGLNLLKWK